MLNYLLFHMFCTLLHTLFIMKWNKPVGIESVSIEKSDYGYHLTAMDVFDPPEATVNYVILSWKNPFTSDDPQSLHYEVTVIHKERDELIFGEDITETEVVIPADELTSCCAYSCSVRAKSENFTANVSHTVIPCSGCTLWDHAYNRIAVCMNHACIHCMECARIASLSLHSLVPPSVDMETASYIVSLPNKTATISFGIDVSYYSVYIRSYCSTVRSLEQVLIDLFVSVTDSRPWVSTAAIEAEDHGPHSANGHGK